MMRNLFPTRVPQVGNVLCCMAIFSFFLSTMTLAVTSLFANQGKKGKPLKEKATLEVQKLQMPFIANNGQVDERVLFYAQTFGGTVFVNKDGQIVYALPDGRHGTEGTKDREGNQTQNHLMQDARGIALKEQFVGSKIDEIKGGSKSVATVNYFTGNDPSKWQSNIPTYEIVEMGEVYEGIDLRLKAYGNNVEKLFTVKPDANYEKILIRLEGAQELMVNTAGELIAETELGAVKFTKPIAYQEIEGKRVNVECGYVISDCGIQKSEYGFKVAQYDKAKDLIIDPLLASTYLGGPYEDRGRSIAVDAEGNVFVAGETLSSEFPSTPGAYRTSRKGNTDVFVSKFNSGLTNLLASTFLGGALNHERTCSVATDVGGNVYVAGSTYSTDFPKTRGSYDATGNGRWDVFVSKFNNGLTNLLASTLLGGNADDCGYAIAIDAGGNVYVTGETLSSDFPATPGAYDTTYNGGYYDAFVSKFDSGLTSLLASTFLGGGSGDYGRAIAVDGVGNVFVTGNTWPRDFPATPGAYNTSFNGGNDDAFVSKLNNGLMNLLASTFLGGNSNDHATAIAIDTGGNVYVTGETVSSNFPTTDSAYATAYKRGTKDVFVSKFNNQLTGLSASTLLGGDAHDYSKAIAIDAGENVYVAGSTSSTDFPTTPGAYDTTPNGGSEVFLSKLNSGLANLLMSTFLGGSRSDYGNAIAVSAAGNVYVTGETLSPDFPATPAAYDASYHRCEDVFVSRFNDDLSVDKANK
ncbi:MAG: hypothetical protein E3K36_08695 [Candidatus Brocadia sp.]|nr:hypothetical protein [Candidatus Brocadia sp.]